MQKHDAHEKNWGLCQARIWILGLKNLFETAIPVSIGETFCEDFHFDDWYLKLFRMGPAMICLPRTPHCITFVRLFSVTEKFCNSDSGQVSWDELLVMDMDFN